MPVFISVPKKSNAKECSSYHTIFWRKKWQPTPVFLPGKSHGQRSLVGYSSWGRKEMETTERLSTRHTCTHLTRSKVMLKILQAGLYQHKTEDFQRYKLDLERAEEPEIKLPTLVGSRKNKRIPENIYFCVIDYAKSFDCVGQNKLWKILQEMGIPDYLTWILWNLYAGQEATVRTGHGTIVKVKSESHSVVSDSATPYSP